MRIYTNFWVECPDNVHYKVIYMMEEAISRLKPRCWFLLPEIRNRLEQCIKNQSSYLYWGKGNGDSNYL